MSISETDQHRPDTPKPSHLLAAESSGRTNDDSARRIPWHRWTIVQSLVGGGLLWLSLPPMQIAPLAWIGPVFWIQLIRRSSLVGKRPYRALTLAGFLFWVATLHWMTLPHWSAGIGMLVLSAYLALYLPAFVGLSRVAVHTLGIPVILAAPVVFTGLELARAHLFSGFSMAALAHTQYQWIDLIQISDLAGAYGVTFLITLVAACFARVLPSDGSGFTVWPVLPAGAAVAASLAYGSYQTGGTYVRSGEQPVIALVQGTIDTKFGVDAKVVKAKTYEQYMRLSDKITREIPNLDLIVWPESMYRLPLVEHEDETTIPPQFTGTAQDWSNYLVKQKQAFLKTTNDLRTPMLLGVDAYHVDRQQQIERYATSVYVDYDARSHTASIAGRYDKMHPVMFGEYVPFGEQFPFLYQLTPLPGGLTPGARAESFEIGSDQQFRITPNICFESVVPHLVRSQVADLKARGKTPDVLIAQTNDGWFWGSSALDMHLVCSVFRAIECRTPYLTAANTGISAYVDANGRIVESSPRRQEDVIVAQVDLDSRDSLYVRYGDLLAGICLMGCLALAVTGLFGRRSALRSKIDSEYRESD